MDVYGRIIDLKLEAESWTQYEERLPRDFLLNNIEYANKKRAILLSVIGAETLPRHQHQEICQSSRAIWASWSTVAGSFPICQPSQPPFTSCCRKSPGFDWSKQLLMESDLLVHFSLSKEVVLEVVLSCDASPRGLDAVISHVIDGMEQPIRCASCTVHYHKLKSSIPCLRKKPWLWLGSSYSCLWKSTALVFNNFSIWHFLQVQARSAVV